MKLLYVSVCEVFVCERVGRYCMLSLCVKFVCV